MILVTGGTGLIGSHLLYDLVKDQGKVRAIYRNESRIAHVRDLFVYYDPISGLDHFNLIEWIQGDVLDVIELNEVMKDVEYVYHCAALVSFHRRDFSKLMIVNRQGTANVVNACLENNIKKLCYISSTAAIGGEGLNVSEKSKWVQSPTTSGYSISKYSAEKEVWRGIEEGLDAVIVNPSIVFGAGKWDESSLTIFRTIQDGLPFYTCGANAFVDARDVSKVMIQLMQTEQAVNNRFLCFGVNLSFREAFNAIALQMNKKVAQIEVKPFLLQLAWRIAGFIGFITRKRPTITKESARSAFKQTAYNRAKLDQMIKHTFYSLEESIENTIKFNKK
jgi:dihydroflavonol-4-reductase